LYSSITHNIIAKSQKKNPKKKKKNKDFHVNKTTIKLQKVNKIKFKVCYTTREPPFVLPLKPLFLGFLL